jgi:hypothetical protein
MRALQLNAHCILYSFSLYKYQLIWGCNPYQVLLFVILFFIFSSIICLCLSCCIFKPYAWFNCCSACVRAAALRHLQHLSDREVTYKSRFLYKTLLTRRTESTIQVERFELSSSAWKADSLPLTYTCFCVSLA